MTHNGVVYIMFFSLNSNCYPANFYAEEPELDSCKTAAHMRERGCAVVFQMDFYDFDKEGGGF